MELMSGAEPILTKACELVDSGEYLLAVEILNKLVHAEPGNVEARQLLADAFEQVGYQQESPSVRNSFLAAALELRSGMRPVPPPAAEVRTSSGRSPPASSSTCSTKGWTAPPQTASHSPSTW